MEVLPADQWVVKDQAQAWEVPSLCRPGAISVSMWGFLQPQGTPSYHSRQMGLVVPHFRYIYIFGTPLVEHTHSASQLVRHFDSCSCIRYFSSVIALPGPCQVTDLIAKGFSFMAVEQMCHGWSPLRGPIKGAATRWSKTQNQNDENWVADGGSNGRPYFFKLHLRLDDSSSSWRAMLSAELSNVGALPMVTIAHFMQLQSVQGGDRLGNRWLCRMKTWCQMCVSSGNQT